MSLHETESLFAADFRALLAKHGIDAPRFAHSAKAFNPSKPQVLYSGPVYDADELVAATAALCEGKWSVAGEYVNRFEKVFSAYLGQAESVMVNSGSSADLLMIAAAKARYGWRDGDGVIVSPVGFPTSISAITLNGLKPVFVDIEWETLNADNDAIEHLLVEDAAFKQKVADHLSRPDEWMDTLSSQGASRCQRRDYSFIPMVPPICAILISPVLGNPPDIDRLVALSERYGVKLLLDGCDSLGTTWRGKHLAHYATASTCSFFPAHHISTLQGGMISSNDTDLIALARSMGSWGKACYCTGAGNLLPNGCCGKRFLAWLADEPDLILDHRYVFTTDKAWNTQPLDIQGALGLVQMEKIEDIHAARRVAFDRVDAALDCLRWRKLAKSNRHIGQVSELTHADPSWFGVPIICPTYAFKTALMSHLEAAGIQTRHAFAGHLLRQPGYKHLGRAEDYPNADQVLKLVFFLGTNPLWGPAHFSHIESTLQSFTPPSCTSTA